VAGTAQTFPAMPSWIGFAASVSCSRSRGSRWGSLVRPGVAQKPCEL
jgi:hypothetical protein